MSTEQRYRDDLISSARAVAARGLSHGTTGNLSVRFGDRFLVTPTRRALAAVEAHELALVDLEGHALTAATPSKEALLHAAVYRNRPETGAIVHTHSLYATAISCLAELDCHDAIPPLTAYYAMRVAALPVVDYRAPGDERLAQLVGEVARTNAAMLLRNHGPVVAAASLSDAVDVIDEIEQAAKLHLLLRGYETAAIPAAERNRLFTRTT